MQKTYTAQFTSEVGQKRLKVFRVTGTAAEQRVNGEIQKLLKNQGILSAEIAPVAPGIPLDAIVKGMLYTVAYITV